MHIENLIRAPTLPRFSAQPLFLLQCNGRRKVSFATGHNAMNFLGV